MKNKKSYIWNIIGRFVPQTIYLCATIILAHLLTPTDFGIIGTLSIFIGVANTLLDAGLGGSLIKEKSPSLLDYSSIFVFNIIVSLILYISLYVCAPLVESYFNLVGLGRVLKWLSLCFIIYAFGLVPNTILIKNLRFKDLMIRNIISTSISALISILLALSKSGVYSLVIYQLLNAAITTSLSYYYSKYTLSFKFSISNFKKLFSFGFFTTICNIIDSIYENLLTFLFGKFLGVKNTGYLAQAKKLEVSLTQTLTTTINTVSFPLLTKLRDDIEVFKEECQSTTKTVSYFLFPVLWIVALYSDLIINFIFGSQWGQAAIYLALLTYAGLALVLESLYRNYVKSLTLVRPLLFNTLLKRIVTISILIITTYTDKDYLIYTYIICTYIGLIFNIFLYFRSVNTNFFIGLYKLITLLLPPIFLYIPLFIIKVYCLTPYISIFLNLTIVLFFYLWTIYKLDFNLRFLYKKRNS